jgi:cell filamentation protein
VTFDPFGDFETQGYLRNLAKEKDPDIVRRLEHASFMTGIDTALERLAKIRRLTYPDVLETHRILFDAVYPWAGQDRRMTIPDLAISKGPVLFAHGDARCNGSTRRKECDGCRRVVIRPIIWVNSTSNKCPIT